MLFGSIYKGKLPNKINGWKFQSENKDHPYYQNNYRKKDSLDTIIEYIWREEYQNISKWINSVMTENNTYIPKDKIPNDKELYSKISDFYTRSPIHLLRIQLAEVLTREYLNYLADYKIDYFCNKFEIEKANLQSIRIFSTNKVDDIKYWTDFIVQMEYHNVSTKKREIKTLFLDLKNKNYNSNLESTKYNANLIWDEWIYSLWQTKLRKEIKGKVLNFYEEISDPKKDIDHDQYLIELLEHIDTNINQIIAGIQNHKTLTWDSSRLIEMLKEWYTRLEDKMLLSNNINDDVIEDLQSYIKETENLIWEYKIKFELPISKNQIKKQFSINKSLMNDIFMVTFQSIKKYWFVNMEDKKIRNKFESISKKDQSSIKQAIISNFSYTQYRSRNSESDSSFPYTS